MAVAVMGPFEEAAVVTTVCLHNWVPNWKTHSIILEHSEQDLVSNYSTRDVNDAQMLKRFGCWCLG